MPEVTLTETVLLTEAIRFGWADSVSDVIPTSDSVASTVGSGGYLAVINGYSFQMGASTALSTNEVYDLSNYSITPVDGGCPVIFESASPFFNQLASGADGSFIVDLLDANGGSSRFFASSGSFTPDNEGDYLDLSSIGAPVLVRILSVVDAQTVELGGRFNPVDAENGSISWNLNTAIIGITLSTTKMTGGASYRVQARNLRTKTLEPVVLDFTFVANAARPQLSPNIEVTDDGVVLADFGEPMRSDAALTGISEYSIAGPTTVEVTRVSSVDPQRVAIFTKGLSTGSYTLTVNATGTPKDIAGNPINPLFNTAIFSGFSPLTPRSIYTDKGPIAKPPLTLQVAGLVGSAASIASVTLGVVTVTGLSGMTPLSVGWTLNIFSAASAANNGSFVITEYVSSTSVRYVNSVAVFPDANSGSILWSSLASFIDATDVFLPGAALTPDHVGLYITLSGSALNDGTFRILAIASASRATLQASFTLPDTNSGAVDWSLVDPRQGQIADDPTDVAVRVNSLPVVPDAVIGLLGQVVLPTAPSPTDDVKIDYRWICNPVVDVRRLNSKEFRLNSWNRDIGYPNDGSQHKYRYNNSLIKPETFIADDMQSVLDQPLLRDLKYRAYERAYTPVLNDPNLLVLNTPTHRIAYPPMQRQLTEQFIRYEALTLPDVDPAAPWLRKGSGLASVSLGVLTIQDNTTGIFPTGEPLFWVRGVDLTFPHVFALAWRCEVPTIATFDGVFSGLAAGYSDELLSTIVGFLDDGGVRKIGFLRRGSSDNPALLSSWVGGFDLFGASTMQPVEFDWSPLHSYRLFRDPTGAVKLFVDGDVTEIARIVPDDLPFLEELNAPFDAIQDVFFGSISRPAESTSNWDFVRYLSIPLNPQQTAPSSFTSYEGNVVPELDTKPWTPVGFHGTETILSTDFLLLDSTSATDVDPLVVGLVGADFRGFVRLEPLLTAASEVVLDVSLDLRTHTFGVTPDGLMAAIDNGDRLIQLCFFPDTPAPKKSYGGRSLPEDFSPYFWSGLGGATAEMAGRILKITDSVIGDGRVYFVNDTASPLSTDPLRVVLSSIDYILEFRAQVVSYTADVAGFVGVYAQIFDSTRAVGLMLTEVLGIRYVAFTSDGADLGPTARFAFNWNDGRPHTYRATKSTTGDLVSLFVDGTFLGAFTYSSFLTPPPDPTGQISFGSSTPLSASALSVVDWFYCNAWRVLPNQRHYVGLWNGSDPDSLTGYHLPLKTSGRGATVVGNALGDPVADFFAQGVVAGDLLVVDVGSNKGVYEVAAVSTPTTLTIIGVWPTSPSIADYRIVQETDWTVQHKYRILKNPTGDVSVLIDSDPLPIISTTYSSTTLPSSTAGVVGTLTGGVAGIAWGSFEPTDLSQSAWDFVRYGITRSVTELRIVPPHQVLNQWNVMASPEHLRSSIPHSHTSFKSSSTGIPPKLDPDFLQDPNLVAFTLLNEGTPLVPQTQSFEVRGPYPTQEYVSALNRPEDVLNNDGDFTLNDGSIRYRLIVPDDVLYTSLDVIERTAGVTDLLSPFCDDCGLLSLALQYTKEVCLTYDGSILPEDDTSAPTPWELVSDNPAQVTTSAFAGVLTYSTGVVGTRTVYRNNTPLPDAPGLQTEATFRIRLTNDSTAGTGDSQVRFGLSAPGMTVGLAFITTPTAERFVLAIDLNTSIALGSVAFDYLDGLFHTYRIVRDPSANLVQIFIDS